MADKKKFKITINTLTSWGASVVIIGVMAKLLRWHAADTLIIIGMLTEAILFFILGFQSDEIKVIQEEDVAPVNTYIPQGVSNVANVSPSSANSNPIIAAPIPALNIADYQEELDKMSDHLKNLNATYESMSIDLENVELVGIHTKRVKEETEKLAKNLTALNSVYKNMLGALNMPNA